MADDGSKQGRDVWPLPKFRFSVDFGDGKKARFQEVSGLDTEAQPIGFRRGDSEAFSKIKMPGLNKAADVTMKRGVFKDDGTFSDWLKQVGTNTSKRRTITISLLDETGAAKRVWILHNARPTKITGTDLKSDGNEVAIESIEIAHEGLTVANA
jgi:phage tail-like protein